MQRRIISGIAAVVLTFSGAGTALANIADLHFEVAASAAAESGTCGEALTWTLDDEGTLTISGTGDIPDYGLDYNTFLYLYPWNAGSVKSVIIGEGVTSIGMNAFADCTNLTSVTISDTVTKIGYCAFDCCKNLTSVTIPSSVESIDYSAFGFYYEDMYSYKQVENFKIYCTKGSAGEKYARENGFDYELIVSETTIVDSGECGENLTWTLDNEGTLTVSGSGEMPDFDYEDNKSPWFFNKKIHSVVIGDGITNIGANAFTFCKNILDVTIPDSVTSINNNAFELCSSLMEVTVPDSVTSIGEKAFSMCYKLKSILIPRSVTSIGADAFDNTDDKFTILCGNDSEAEKYAVDNGIKYELVAFTSDDIIAYGSCGENLTWTLNAEGTFTISGTGKMTDFTAANIPWDTNKFTIKKVIIGDGVESIGDNAFFNCNNLESINFPDSIESIGSNAFFHCDSFENLTIPGSIKSIDYEAFSCCENLKSVTIENGVTSIGSDAFYYCPSLESVTLPDSITSIADCTFSNCKKLTDITIPDSVTNIGSGAFSYCKALESITVPDSVTSIGKEAFQYCTNLKSVTLPNGITSIENKTFYNCSKLTDITIPDSVTRIGRYAFYQCKNLSSVTIPDSVKSISNFAFANCSNLTSIIIPKSVTAIGTIAFGDVFGNGAGIKLYCYKGTAGEKYAIDNEYDYELIEEGTPANPVPAATPGDGCVTLKWEAVENAEKYAVAVEVNGSWTVVEKTSDTSYVLKGLKAGTEYNVAVIAKFDGNWNTDFSGAIVVTPNAAVSKYPEVTNIDYSEKYHQFRLTWNAIEGATEYGVAVKLGGKWKVQQYTDKTSFTSPKLKQGSTVEMVICAKVNGKWDTDNINSRAFKVTVK